MRAFIAFLFVLLATFPASVAARRSKNPSSAGTLYPQGWGLDGRGLDGSPPPNPQKESVDDKKVKPVKRGTLAMVP